MAEETGHFSPSLRSLNKSSLFPFGDSVSFVIRKQLIIETWPYYLSLLMSEYIRNQHYVPGIPLLFLFIRIVINNTKY